MAEVKRLSGLTGSDLNRRVSMGHGDNWQIDGRLWQLDVQQEFITETTIMGDCDEYPAELTYNVRVGPWEASFPGYIADEITVLVE